MGTIRLSSSSRRRQILDAAKGCFAERGFEGTTTKRLAAAAGISEGLLFRHFPTKSSLYAETLAEACEADPELKQLLELSPSTATLVTLVREMVRHFMQAAEAPHQEDAQRIRLLISSHLGDGEFARLLYAKIGALIGPVFTASLESAIAARDAVRLSTNPIDLFWFAHQTVHLVALTRLPAVPSIRYAEAADLERQLGDFILRGIGLTDAAIEANQDCALSAVPMHSLAAESA
jgi:AcrR family transcriptional regulator